MITDAIQVEQYYLKLLSNHEAKTAFDLIGKMASLGYTLDEYHKAKDEYLFAQTPKVFRMTTPETTHDDVSDAIKSNDSVVFVAAPTKTWMYGGGDNKKVPEGVSFCDIGYPCESIFATDKDVNLVITSRQNGVLHLWQEWLNSELVGIKHESTIGAEKRLGNWSVYYFQIYFKEGREILLKKWEL